MRWQRWSTALAFLAAVGLGLGCSDTALGPANALDRGALFDDLWTQFDLHYSFFEVKGINWDSLGRVYRPLAVAAPTDAGFGQALGQMLATLRDVHVSVTPTDGAAPLRYVSPFETLPTGFHPLMVMTHYLTNPRTSSGGHLTFGMVAPTVAYVRIPSFAGSGWAGEMDDALTALAGARSAIIDVRDNMGGDYATAVSVAGRFADRARTFGYIRRRSGPAHDDFSADVAETLTPAGPAPFTGRVIVLANRGSFSSAENFVLAMRSLPFVTVVGDTTAGASGGPIVRELANGWSYQLSEWIEYTLAHHFYEGIGLAPDVVVRVAGLNGAAGLDAVLDRALSLLAR